MKKIAVTGGSGASGRFIVRRLLDEGYEVVNVDRAPSLDCGAAFRRVDITDYDSLHSAVEGCEAIVHFAANPEPDFDFHTGADRFENNTMGTFNAFQVAAAQGMKRIVWASSETAMGFPFDSNRPLSVPVDESHPPQPQNSYAISKVICEDMARHFNRLYKIPIIGLRLSNVLYDGNHRDTYAKIPDYWQDLTSRKFNMWSYIDAEDAAQAVSLSLTADIDGAENFIIAAKDTIMNVPSRELIERVMPGVPVDGALGEFEALETSEKAKKLLGWEAKISWRDKGLE